MDKCVKCGKATVEGELVCSGCSDKQSDASRKTHGIVSIDEKDFTKKKEVKFKDAVEEFYQKKETKADAIATTEEDPETSEAREYAEGIIAKGSKEQKQQHFGTVKIKSDEISLKKAEKEEGDEKRIAKNADDASEKSGAEKKPKKKRKSKKRTEAEAVPVEKRIRPKLTPPDRKIKISTQDSLKKKEDSIPQEGTSETISPEKAGAVSKEDSWDNFDNKMPYVIRTEISKSKPEETLMPEVERSEEEAAEIEADITEKFTVFNVEREIETEGSSDNASNNEGDDSNRLSKAYRSLSETAGKGLGIIVKISHPQGELRSIDFKCFVAISCLTALTAFMMTKPWYRVEAVMSDSLVSVYTDMSGFNFGIHSVIILICVASVFLLALSTSIFKEKVPSLTRVESGFICAVLIIVALIALFTVIFGSSTVAVYALDKARLSADNVEILKREHTMWLNATYICMVICLGLSIMRYAGGGDVEPR